MDSLALHLGWRYLRTRRAAWLAFAAITLTVAVPVVVIGVTQGFLEVTARQARANESDVTATPSWFGNGITDTPDLRQRVAAIPGVAAVAPFIGMYGLMVPRLERSGGDNGVPVQVDAIDWRADTAIGRLALSALHPPPVTNLSAMALPADRRGTGFLTPAWRSHLVLTGLDVAAGMGACMPLPPRQRPAIGVVAGREVLYGSGIQIGMPVQIVGGTGTKIAVEVSDTIGTGILEIDRFALLIPLGHGQVLAGYHGKAGGPRQIGGLRLQATPGTQLDQLANQVHTTTGLRGETWLDRRGNMVKSLELQRNVIGLVMVLIQITTVFIVYAVFSTMVAEKRHDIGVLLGIGARPRSIAGAFLIAGTTCCLLGGLLGWLVGWSALAGLNPLSKYLGIPLFPQDVFYTPDAPASYDPLIPLFFIAIMTLIGLAAVAVPAWRAARIQPVDILREGA